MDDAPLTLRGQLPPWLRGTLLLNGPALWELPQGGLQHWFDGYAMLHALRLTPEGGRYRSRFIQSQSYQRSVAAGKPFYGEFGTASPASLWTRLRAPQITDNPAVVMNRHGQRWFAVTETPMLTYFNPDTLATEERLDLGASAAKLHLMAAHGFTLADGSYLNVGTTLGPSCVMKLFRLPVGSTEPEVIASISMPRCGYTHAFALAGGHAIVWETALRARPLAFRFGGGSYASNFDWAPEVGGGSRLHAITLATGRVRSWRIPPMMAFHATQAWAEGDELVMDLATYDDGALFNDLMLEARRADRPISSRLRQTRYRLRDGESHADVQALPTAIELQQVHPARGGASRASAAWGVGNGDAEHNRGQAFSHVVRVDVATGQETARFCRAGALHLEPLFVPEPGAAADDAGVLLVPTLAADDATTVIAVVDAATLKPVAELHAPQVIPFGFHAAWNGA